MKTAHVLALITAFAFACSDDGSDDSQDQPDASAGSDGGGGGIDAAPTADGAPVPPGTPVLVTASLVTHGTMSLAWQNPASTCATVAINRKKDAGAYAVAQTLTGQATAAQDMPGHTNGTYCYTITCTLGAESSAPSNEKCVTQ